MCRPLRECFARVLDCRPKSHSVKGGKLARDSFIFRLRMKRLIYRVVRYHIHNFVGFFYGAEPNISEAEREVCFDFYKSPITL